MRSIPASLIALAALTLLLVACRGGARTPPNVKIPLFTPTPAPQRCLNELYPAEAPQFEADQFEYRTLDSGLQVLDIATGTGPMPSTDDVVNVRFSGFLPDGCVFTTSYVQEEPVAIALEASIPGIQEGVSTMQVGGQRRLRIPPGLAYGDAGFPGRVPPGSAVIFVVDLREIVDITATSTPESATSTPPLPPAPETPEPGTEGVPPTATP